MRSFRVCWAALAACSIVGCTEAPELGENAAEVRNGTIVHPWDPDAFRYARSIVHIGGCTGTIVQRRWVLTAKHCGIAIGQTVASERPTTTVTRTVDRIATHPTLDVVLLHLTQDMPTDAPSATPYGGTEASLYGKTVTCYGYGAKAATPVGPSGTCPAGTWLQGFNCLTPSAELRSGDLVASDAGVPGYFATTANAAGQMMLPGDSGGPCFRGDALAGVNSWWSFDLSGGGQVSAPAFRTWVNRTIQPAVKGDYDNDGKTDLALWRPSNGTWYVLGSSAGVSTLVWGETGDTPVLGDFDGDGRMDQTVWRPSNGTWYVHRSSDGTTSATAWGIKGDIPVPGDYDGDGFTDLAVWRPSNATWYVIGSADGTVSTRQWGQLGDVPAPGDYDGDMRSDLVVWRPSNGTWYVIRSSDGSVRTTAWGQVNDYAKAADYDGDGLHDPAVFRSNEGKWYVMPSSTNGGYWQGWGQSGDHAVPGDYNGDGKADVAVFRPLEHTWYIWLTGGGSYSQGGWGEPGDIALAGFGF